MEDEEENYDDYNQEEDYNEEDYEENNIKEEKEEKNEIKLNEKAVKDYEIIQYKEIIKKRDAIINKFIEFSELNYDEAELVLIDYDWNYDKLMEYWFDNIEKIKIDSHIEQSEDSIKAISKYFTNNKFPENTCLICESEFNPDEAIS